SRPRAHQLRVLRAAPRRAAWAVPGRRCPRGRADDRVPPFSSHPGRHPLRHRRRRYRRHHRGVAPRAGRDWPRAPVGGRRLSAADTQFEQLVQTRFDALVERFPTLASYLGLHDHDSKLADGTLDAQLQDIEDTRTFIAAIEAVDESQLSDNNQFDRQLALYSSRLALFDDEVHR